jgi:hypothetical protein
MEWSTPTIRKPSTSSSTQHVPQLQQDTPNYAWSFELITPEDGLVLESDERLLEISFDFLMYQNHRAVLGDCADRFGYEFPIRFDFLDTFDKELVSKPAPIDEEPGWRRLHLPTHPELLFDVQRLEFTGQVKLETDGSCQVLSLVDRQSVTLVTANGIRQHFNYAETFVVPAAARQYQPINDSDQPVQVVVAYVKPNHARLERTTG